MDVESLIKQQAAEKDSFDQLMQQKDNIVAQLNTVAGRFSVLRELIEKASTPDPAKTIQVAEVKEKKNAK